jgi:hypothetical protein
MLYVTCCGQPEGNSGRADNLCIAEGDKVRRHWPFDAHSGIGGLQCWHLANINSITQARLIDHTLFLTLPFVISNCQPTPLTPLWGPTNPLASHQPHSLVNPTNSLWQPFVILSLLPFVTPHQPNYLPPLINSPLCDQQKLYLNFRSRWLNWRGRNSRRFSNLSIMLFERLRVSSSWRWCRFSIFLMRFCCRNLGNERRRLNNRRH